MKLLAIDTSTEQCSVAILSKDTSWSRVVPTARNHADMILPMVNELLQESGLAFSDLDGLAFGRGPGSFTGVRIAVGVVQGLAFATHLRVAGISNLAAVAQQATDARHLSAGSQILVCMDARMQEVYWAVYGVSVAGLVVLLGEERVSPPAEVTAVAATLSCGAGTGWNAYPELREHFHELSVDAGMLPRAIDIAKLGLAVLQAGLGVAAAEAQPVYLRDEVARPAKT
jgi:tRNA threonylcarbamoyladenosine biosynthesis protein TsaB